MRKNILGKKFSRDTTSRRAMYRALVRSFFLNQKLVTTHTKAKIIVPVIENLLYKGKLGTLEARRRIYAFTGNDREVTDEIIKVSKEIKDPVGSRLKYINLPARKGDNAPMVRVEFVQKIIKSSPEKGVVNTKKGPHRAKQEPENIGKRVSISSVIKRLPLQKKTAKK